MAPGPRGRGTPGPADRVLPLDARPKAPSFPGVNWGGFRRFLLRACLGLALLRSFAVRSETRCVVATYNLENYHIRDWGNRSEKPAASRDAVVRVLAAIHPDVVALQEIGEPAALEQLQSALAAAGVSLPHREHVTGWDTNIFVAVLSRFPIVRRASHTNDGYLLAGRRFHTSRGIAEVDIAVTPTSRFTLMTAHLKSRRPVGAADESDLREQEARILRHHIDESLLNSPRGTLLVCGDLNDSPASKSLHLILGRGRGRLIDTRPAEQSLDFTPGETAPLAPPTDATARRSVTWTHFFAKEDTYSRIDYILLAPGMVAWWKPESGYVGSGPDWGLASDHRPVVCELLIP